MDQKQGFEVTPSFKMPNGFEIRDDEDRVFLYRENRLVETFTPCVTVKQIVDVIQAELAG